MDSASLRMIDANRNRASEGLRVAEDYCRFCLADPHLTEHCKRLRHELTAALAVVPELALVAARETQADVGTHLTTAAEQERGSLESVCTASWHRVQQALRVIEECLKLSHSREAATVESLRYRTYTLAKACTVTADSRERLKTATLYVLIDGADSDCAFVDRVESLVEAGVDILQLRDKRLDDKNLLARARLLRRTLDQVRQNCGEEQADQPRPLFVVNDRPDIAALARADGVHVGQEELSVHEVRQIVGATMLVGVSTHSIEQARQAVLDGASYLGCGPTFPTSTKEFSAYPGVDFLRQVAAEIALPAFAIGGISEQNLSHVLQTGMRRVAVSSAIMLASDPVDSARQFKRLLQEWEPTQ